MKKDKNIPSLTEDEKKLIEKFMPEDLPEISALGIQRRHFLKLITLTGGWNAGISDV